MIAKRNLLSASAAALLLFTGAAHAVELAPANSGFEAGDTSDWEYFPTADSTFDAVTPGNGSTYAGYLFNPTPTSGAVIKLANLGAGSLVANSMVTISFDARGFGINGGVAFAELFSEIAGGGTSSSEILGGGPLALNADSAIWESFSFTTMLGPDVSGGLTLQFAAVTGAAAGSVMGLYLDNISIDAQVVPLPAAAWLMLSGIGALFGFRRFA